MAPADIILSQLGGRGRLKVTIGAKDFYSKNDGNTLQFKFAMCKLANLVEITLNGSDLYDVKFIKVGRLNKKTWEVPTKVTGEFSDVSVENLMDVIEDFTGLYLTLGSRAS